MVLGKSPFEKSIKYVLENCFFKLGPKVFLQVVGILIISDSAKFVKNFFLLLWGQINIKNETENINSVQTNI